MDRADSHLVVDIGIAASKEAMRSALIKVEALPLGLRMPALAIALQLVAVKATSLRRAMPDIDGLAAIVDGVQADDEALLRQMLERRGFSVGARG
ncbi:MAG: hypothetical protein ACK40O_00960 [Allosphingosinicella sp.]